MKIDIEGLNKVKLVKALYDFAKPTEKTDAYREITLEDIAYFVNKDRKTKKEVENFLKAI